MIATSALNRDVFEFLGSGNLAIHCLCCQKPSAATMKTGTRVLARSI